MRALGWSAAVALVVLCGRTIAYALEPSPLARTLRDEVGGPSLPAVSLVALLIALALSSAVVWLAALGVRERALLENRRAPRVRLGRLLVRAGCLSAASLAAFTLLESYVHWRAGLGWHGLHCLTGPVHSDALPILLALSLSAVAGFGAVEHVVAWMRRTIAALAAPGVVAARDLPLLSVPEPLAVAGRTLAGTAGARAPPSYSS